MSDDLTKLSFNAVPRAMTALEVAAEMTGDTKTDTANRALQVYAGLLNLSVGEALALTDRDGTERRFMRITDGA